MTTSAGNGTGRVDSVSTDDPTATFITPRVAAGVLFTDDQDRILMVVPTYKDYLDIPGGYVEHGETPYQAAQREVFEELGIKPPIGRLLVADWWQDSPEANGGAKLLLIFNGGRLLPDQRTMIAVDGEEIAAAEFRDLEDLDELTIARLANRIRKAVAALANEAVFYLEDGQDKPTQHSYSDLC